MRDERQVDDEILLLSLEYKIRWKIKGLGKQVEAKKSRIQAMQCVLRDKSNTYYTLKIEDGEDGESIWRSGNQ